MRGDRTCRPLTFECILCKSETPVEWTEEQIVALNRMRLNFREGQPDRQECLCDACDKRAGHIPPMELMVKAALLNELPNDRLPG